MEFFREWCLSVCLTLVISVIFSIFTPQGAMQRFYKIVISVFVFISFIYPLKDFDADDFSAPEANLIIDIGNNASRGFENQINSSVKQFLNKNGITGCNVESSVKYYAQSREIEIKELTVFLPDEYSDEEVKKMIFDKLGLNSRVVYLGK